MSPAATPRQKPFPHLPSLDAAKTASLGAVRIALQLLVIIGVCMVGNDLAAKLPIAIPGTIISMVLLLILLATGVLRVLYIKDACEFLLGNMSVFFIPAGVSVASGFSAIAPELPKLLIICAITTVLVFAVTSATVVVVMRWQTRTRSRCAQSSPLRLDEAQRQAARPAGSAVEAAVNAAQMVIEQDAARDRKDTRA